MNWWVIQACFLAFQEKTQGEKTQNSIKKTPNSRMKLKFSAFKSGEIEVNIGVKCFLPVLLKEKSMENIKKAKLILKIWIEAKTQAKTQEKTQNSRQKLKNSASH